MVNQIVPRMGGIPGGHELLLIFLLLLLFFAVPMVAAIQIHRDASANDVDNPVTWSLGMLVVGFVGNIIGVIAVWILYTFAEVRE